MENQKKSSLLKMFAAFTAGGVVVALVLMSTTGSLFAGNLFRNPKVKDISITRDIEIPKIEKCLNECDLTQEVKILKSDIQDLKNSVHKNYEGIRNLHDKDIATNNNLDALREDVGCLHGMISDVLDRVNTLHPTVPVELGLEVIRSCSPEDTGSEDPEDIPQFVDPIPVVTDPVPELGN